MKFRRGRIGNGLAVLAGARPDVLAAAQGVRIPIFGRAESLNLAAAAAVCLYASAVAQSRPRDAG